MQSEYFEILNDSNEVIRGDLRVPKVDFASSIIIFSHGFKGFRNWSFIPFVCDEFAKNNFISINFDFSRNGITDDINQIYDNNIFRKNTVSHEINDLKKLIDKIVNLEGTFAKLDSLWNRKIYLVGHSLGGAVSILASKDYEAVKKISLWASVADLDRNTKRQKDAWKEKGYTELTIQPTGQKLHLDYTYIEDKDEVLGKGVVFRAISELEFPIQINHPAQDKTVNIREAYKLKSSESNIRTRELNVIDRSGHLFNCKHPFTEPSKAIKEVLGLTLNFFNN